MTTAPWWVLPIASIVLGCASNPDQSVYVMAAPSSVNTALPAASGRSTLTLRSVILPDYLDTTDLVTRTGQYGIEASRTGRWGERLSKGVTRALANDLRDRLPDYVVTDGPAGTPTIEIDVTVSAFDVTATTASLTANWAITPHGDDRPPVIRSGTFHTKIVPPGGDLAVVAAMAETVAELAGGIAATAHQ